MAELKPCPFCGGEAEYIPIDYLPQLCGFVRCGNCRVKQYWYSPKDKAIKDMLNLIKYAPTEKLMEYLLMKTRRAEDDK